MASINAAKYDEVSSQEKAALLIISLGKDYSAKLFQHLSDDEISQLTLSITNIRRVEPDVKERVLAEFADLCLAQNYISEGGIEYAREVLERALGADRALTLIERLTSSLQVRPFEFVRKADPNQVLNVIQGEYPQTIALVLSYLDPKQAAMVIATLPQESQVEIITRIATMGAASPEYVHEIERIMERRLLSMGMDQHMVVGGIDQIVAILNSVDRSTEKHILETLELHDMELADEIRSKMFVFEDIIKLNNTAIQRVLKEVENRELATALRMAGDEVKRVIFANVSKRLAEMIKEDMTFMGPVRMRDVEEAQQRIVNIVRKLEDGGEIVIARGEGDDVLV